MAASLAPTLTKKDFNNWLKGALAILFAKEGLTDFVNTEINQCYNSLLQLTPSANVTKSCSCTIDSLPKCTGNKTHRHIPISPGQPLAGKAQLCSKGVCHVLMDGICQNHRFRGPSWKNTDPQKWCTDPYQMAKCYMPPDGYAHKSSMAETDFNGILAVLINNISFQTKLKANLATEPNICTQARQVGREIRHTADHLLSDSDLHNYIDDLINLLCDPVHLINDSKAKDAVNKLKQLKANTLTIHANDITEVLEDSIKETFSEQHQHYLKAIQDHYAKLQTDSVSEISILIAAKKTELEDFTSKQKDDITKHIKERTREISEKKTELEELTSKQKEDISRHAEAKIQEISVKQKELEELTNKQKEDIDTKTREKKTELEEFTSEQKKEITRLMEEKTQDFSVKKTELEQLSSKQKEEITRHV